MIILSAASGRMGRRNYWILLGPLICAALLLLSVLHGPGLLVAAALWALVAAPRFHDFGRSGWWAAGLWAFIGSAVGAARIVEPLMVAPMAFLACLLQLVVAIWLGMVEGDGEANLFGPPPRWSGAVPPSDVRLDLELGA